jgi:hypothetical protein
MALVQRLLMQYKYVHLGDPSSAGSSGGRRLIDLVFIAMESPYSVEILRGVTSSPLDVMVSSMPNPTDSRPWSSGSASAGRSGAIIVASELTAFGSMASSTTLTLSRGDGSARRSGELLTMIERRQPHGRQVDLAMELIVRSSTAGRPPTYGFGRWEFATRGPETARVCQRIWEGIRVGLSGCRLLDRFRHPARL